MPRKVIYAKEGDKCIYCKRGEFKIRYGKYGSFLGCSRYPVCAGMAKIALGSAVANDISELDKEANKLLGEEPI